MIYFDNAATTKPKKEILDIYNKTNELCWFNASRHHFAGVKSYNLLLKAKKLILETLNLSNKEIIFTSGATEANNMAIYGICEKQKDAEKRKRIITTTVEHPSVLNCFKDLEKYFDVVYIDILSDGTLDLIELENNLNTDTILVSVMWVNNIIGAINNIQEVIKLVRKYPRIKLHVDAVQGIGKIPFNFNINDVDLLTLSAHKLHGLKGCGALIYNSNMALANFTEGSKQQIIKSGTIDVASSVALAKTIELTFKNINETIEKVKIIKDYIYNELSKNDKIVLNSDINSNYSPYILNLSYIGVNSETLLHYLEENEICVSISSACNIKLKEPERTVYQKTKNTDIALSAIRLSFSDENTIQEAKKFIEKINNYK